MNDPAKKIIKRRQTQAVSLSNAQLAKAGRGGNKYGARKTKCSAGHRHDSAKEARRCDELQLMEKNGAIRALRVHLVYPLFAGNPATKEIYPVCRYEADFSYEQGGMIDGHWSLVVEDCKGARTPIYRLKAKLMRDCYGIVILET